MSQTNIEQLAEAYVGNQGFTDELDKDLIGDAFIAGYKAAQQYKGENERLREALASIQNIAIALRSELYKYHYLDEQIRDANSIVNKLQSLISPLDNESKP